MKSTLIKLISALCLVSMLLGVSAIGISAAPPTDWSDEKKTALPDYSYSFAVVGDTQVITRDETVQTDNPYYNTKYNGELAKLYDWIVENRTEKNIQFAFHMGDVTDWNNTSEWDLAMENITKLNYKIPNNVVRGNHDGAPRMAQYYTTDVYRASVANGEEYGFFDGRGIANYSENALNAYQTITVGDVMYLMLSLDIGPCKAVIEWANEVIAAHPYHNVVISTHSYLQGDYNNSNYEGSQHYPYMDAPKDCAATQYNPDGKYGPGGSYGVNWDFRLPQHKQGGDAYLYQDATYMLNNLVKKHKNISMVLCGHECSEYVKQISATGDAGNTILQFLVDGQLVDDSFRNTKNGHAGLVAMFYFSADGKKVTTEYYSTLRDQYLHDADNTKTYNVNVVDVPQNVKEFYKLLHSVAEADYSVKDWSDISKAAEAAKHALLSGEAATLNAAAEAFKGVVSSKSKLDRSALNESLAKVESLVEEDYTTESWKKLQKAIEAAEKAQKSQDQAEITKLANELKAAIDSLAAPDYTELNAAIEAAKKYEDRKDEFDAKLWKDFSTALKNAKKNTDSRSQTTINSVTKKLNNAIIALDPPATESGETNTDTQDSEESTEKTAKGCKSSIAASVVLATVLALGIGFRKKEE